MTSPDSTPAVPVSFASVRAALADLVGEEVLTTDQADRTATRLQTLWAPLPGQLGHRSGGLLTELGGYLGGALVLSGAAAVVVPAWSSIPAPVRFLLALFVTVVLAGGLIAVRRSAPVGHPAGGGAAGGGAAGTSHEARLRLASTLGALAAGAAAITVAIPAPDSWELLIGSLAALAVASSGYALVRGAPLLVTVWIAAGVLIEAVLDRADVHGLGLWVTAYAVFAAVWLCLGVRRWGGLVAEPGVAGLLGGVTGLCAAEMSTSEGRGMAIYGLALGVAFAAGCFGLYLGSRRWAALVPAVLIALVVPATALAVVFDSLLAAGVVVALVGLALLVVGWATLAHRRPEPPMAS